MSCQKTLFFLAIALTFAYIYMFLISCRSPSVAALLTGT